MIYLQRISCCCGCLCRNSRWKWMPMVSFLTCFILVVFGATPSNGNKEEPEHRLRNQKRQTAEPFSENFLSNHIFFFKSAKISTLSSNFFKWMV